MSYLRTTNRIGLQFKAGDRISLVGDDQYTGTIKSVDEDGQAFIEWDNGKQGFAFSPVNDKIKKIKSSCLQKSNKTDDASDKLHYFGNRYW